jgi:haloacetate dehalogenase
MLEGFARRRIDTGEASIQLAVGGAGPPLLLLHGYPETHVCWHRVAPRLARAFTVVCPDLRGYGESRGPATDTADHSAYSKRAMARDQAAVMTALGFERFGLTGHDRGGRVAYRLALDHPGRLVRLATLDIVPTYHMWHDLDARLAYRIWHWTFLALPAPGPETVIGRDAAAFWDWKTAPGTKSKDLSSFDPRALAHYRAFFSDPARLHATCEDYRAGRTTDLKFDETDRAAGRKIDCPMLALWGSSGIPSETKSPLDTWREWATDVRGFAIDCGHYLPEENPQATVEALTEFFSNTA